MEKLRKNKHIVISLFIMIFVLGVFPTNSKNRYQLNPNETLHLELADSVLSYADQFMGTRYRRGAASPGAFDCSGFTSYVFSKFGYDLNRTSRGQFHDGDPINTKLVLPGDLVFFGGSRATRTVGHVGIVVSVDGDGFKFIHASRSGIKVSESQDRYYVRRFIGARRVLPEKEGGQPTSLFEKMSTKIEAGVPLLKLAPPINPKKLLFENNLIYIDIN